MIPSEWWVCSSVMNDVRCRLRVDVDPDRTRHVHVLAVDEDVEV